MAEKIGVALVVKGQISASGSSGDRALQAGASIFKGDVVSSAKASAGSLQFLDKTILNVGENSKISLDEYSYNQERSLGQAFFKMAQGTFRAVTGEIVKHNPEAFKLASPLAVIGIRGTETAHTIPAPGTGSTENHLVMVFDGKPVMVQPLGGGAFQVMGQSGVKVEVGQFGAGPVLIMTPQEFKYFQALTPAALELHGAPSDTLSHASGPGITGQTGEMRVQAAQDAALKAQAESIAKAATAAAAKAAAEASAKAAAEAAKSNADAATKAAAEAAAKAAADLAAKSALAAKAAADIAAKAGLEAQAAQQALHLAEVNRAALLQPGAKNTGDTLTLIIPGDPAGKQANTLGQVISGDQAAGTTPGQANNGQVFLSPAAQELLGIAPPPPATPSETTTAVAQTELDLSAKTVGMHVDLAPSLGTAAPYDSPYSEPLGNASPGQIVRLPSTITSVIGTSYGDLIHANTVGTTIDAGGGNDTLLGGAGNDILDGGAGADSIDGGAGSNTVDFSHSAAAVVVDLDAGVGSGGYATGDSYANLQNAIGSSHDDYFVVNQSHMDAHASLDGGPGTDYITVIGTSTITDQDFVNIHHFEGLDLRGTGPLALTLGANADAAGVVYVEAIQFSSAYIEASAMTHAVDLIGSGGADTLIGSANSDTIQGGAGNDTITPGAGADQIAGGGGSDTVVFNGGDHTGLFMDFTGGSGTIKVTGDTDLRILFGGWYTNHLIVDGNTSVKFYQNCVGNFWTFTHDNAAAGPATVEVYAIAGNPNIQWGTLTMDGTWTSSDMINMYGYAGVPVIVGPGGPVLTTVYGADTAETITINSATSHVYAAGGNDTINGGAGSDTIEGGAGADSINGGGGVNTVDFSHSTAGVAVNLINGTGLFGDAAGDTYANIQNVIGSAYNDSIRLQDSGGSVSGGAGSDSLDFKYNPSGGVNQLGGCSGIEEIVLLPAGQNASLVLTDVNTTGLENNALFFNATGYDGRVTLDATQVTQGAVIYSASIQGDTVSFGNNVTNLNTFDGESGDDTVMTARDMDIMTGGGNDHIIYTSDLGPAGSFHVVHTGAGDDLVELKGVHVIELEAGNDTIIVESQAQITNAGNCSGGADFDTVKILGPVHVTDAMLAYNTTEYLRFNEFERLTLGSSDVVQSVVLGPNANAKGLVSVNGAAAGAGLAVDASGMASAVTIIGSSLEGSNLAGGAGADTITGGAGSDTIEGGAGADLIAGSGGNDTFVFNAGGVVSGESVTDNAGTNTFLINADTDFSQAGVSVNMSGSAQVNLTLGAGVTTTMSLGFASGIAKIYDGTLAGVETFITKGTTGNDVFDFQHDVNTSAPVGSGWTSQDHYRLDGNGGADTLDFQLSNTPLTFNVPAGTLSFTQAGVPWSFEYTSDFKTFIGSSANDTFIASAAVETLNGSGGNNTLDYSQSSSGVAVSLSTNSVAYGFAAGDTISNFQNVIGTDFDDDLFGQTTGSVLTGNAGNDVIEAVGGNNTLTGGLGMDALTGGPGTDTFVYNAGDMVSGESLNKTAGTAKLNVNGDTDFTLATVTLPGTGTHHMYLADGVTVTVGPNPFSAFGLTSSELWVHTAAGGHGHVISKGTAGNDTFSWSHFVLEDMGATSSLHFDGGGGSNTMDLSDSSMGLVLNNVTHAFGGAYSGVGPGTVTFTSDFTSFIGGTGDDTFIASTVAETFNGGTGANTVDYTNSATGVMVTLDNNVSSGGNAAGDLLLNIQNVIGSHHDDHITGYIADEVFTPLEGNDTIIGGAGNDTLIYSSNVGGYDITTPIVLTATSATSGSVALSGTPYVQSYTSIEYLYGGSGNDTFNFGQNLSVSVHLYGGLGTDTLSFTQMYQGGLEINDLNNVAVDHIIFGDADTSIVTVNSSVASGQTLTVDALSWASANTFTFNGAAETDGSFIFEASSSGTFTFTGGAGDDQFSGTSGHGTFTGNGGSNTYTYSAPSKGVVLASHQAGVTGDQVTDFHSHSSGGTDFFEISSANFGGISSTVTEGANFITIAGTYNGTNASGSSEWAAGRAALIVDDQHRLIYDANGSSAGYTVLATTTAGHDVAATDVQVTA